MEKNKIIEGAAVALVIVALGVALTKGFCKGCCKKRGCFCNGCSNKRNCCQRRACACQRGRDN